MWLNFSVVGLFFLLTIIFPNANTIAHSQSLKTGNVGVSGDAQRLFYDEKVAAAFPFGVIYVGSDQNLFALDADSGKKIWSFKSEGLIQGNPTVANGIVYFRTYLYKASLYALDAVTGDKIWSLDNNILTDPTYANDKIYVGIEDAFYALNAQTGAVVWKFNVAPLGNHFRGTPAVVDNKVLVFKDRLYALDMTTGVEIWSYQSGSLSMYFYHTAPAIVDGVIYFADQNGYIDAVDAASGDGKWRLYYCRVYCSNRGDPTIADGTLYGANFSINWGDDNFYDVYAIDTKTGTMLWKIDLRGQVYASQTIANGMVYVGSSDGHFYALDSSNGNMVWRFLTGNQIYSGAVVGKDKVYFGSLDNFVYALDPQTGKKIWSFNTGSEIYFNPALVIGK